MALWRKFSKKVLKKLMLPCSRNKISHACIFQQDNDPKHTSKVPQDWLQKINYAF
jgi:hypothetical protein